MKKLIYLLFLSIFFGGTLFAGVKNARDVENFIRNMSVQSQSVLNNTNLNEIQREKEYEKFSASIVDTEWVARFILGKTWRTLTEEQQDRFIKLYTEYILKNYMPKLKDYNSDIVVTKVVEQRENVFMVSTETKDEKNRLINVDFRIIERNNKLYITDIIPEGVSFIGNQRTDVGASINKLGFEGFMKELQLKL